MSIIHKLFSSKKAVVALAGIVIDLAGLTPGLQPGAVPRRRRRKKLTDPAAGPSHPATGPLESLLPRNPPTVTRPGYQR